MRRETCLKGKRGILLLKPRIQLQKNKKKLIQPDEGSCHAYVKSTNRF